MPRYALLPVSSSPLPPPLPPHGPTQPDPTPTLEVYGTDSYLDRSVGKSSLAGFVVGLPLPSTDGSSSIP